jgi:Ca-activated chloride channel family protein
MSMWAIGDTGWSLQDPQWLALLPIAAVMAVLARRGLRVPAATFAPLSLQDDEPLPATWRTRCVNLPDWLSVLAFAVVVLALSRPVVRVAMPAIKTGIDLVVCLDVSSSMAAADMDARRDRLAVAKAAVKAFVAGRPDDRIGLVRFARYPDVVCPPTLDHHALVQMLEDVSLVQRDGPEDATGIGAAIARSVQMLRASTQPSRLVVLVTDGAENVAAAGTPDEIGPLQASQAAQLQGVRVYALAVGVGTRAQDGTEVRMDTSQIEQLAQRTGGRFFAARDANALAEVYAEIAQLERSPVEEPRSVFEDCAASAIALALVLQLLGVMLRRTVLEVLA